MRRSYSHEQASEFSHPRLRKIYTTGKFGHSEEAFSRATAHDRGDGLTSAYKQRQTIWDIFDMPFGEIVVGSPGSGKSTYAYGKYQVSRVLLASRAAASYIAHCKLMTALGRSCTVINLDPANDPAPYPSRISLFELVTVRQTMAELNLGPNGAMLYCMEYLEANFDWLEERLKEEGLGDDDWVIFDCPGQVELSTNHDSLKNIIDRLGKIGFRVCLVFALPEAYSLCQNPSANIQCTSEASCYPPLRCTLCDGRIEIHRSSPSLVTNHVAPGTTAHKRALKNRSHNTVW